MLAIGLAYLVLGSICLCFDHHLVLGEYAWIKPCKFGLSIATYATSLLCWLIMWGFTSPFLMGLLDLPFGALWLS